MKQRRVVLFRLLKKVEGDEKGQNQGFFCKEERKKKRGKKKEKGNGQERSF